MKESVTYQAIRQEGKDEGKDEGIEIGGTVEVRKLILRFGEKRFGSIPSAIEKAINAITALEELERLLESIGGIESWTELLKP